MRTARLLRRRPLRAFQTARFLYRDRYRDGDRTFRRAMQTTLSRTGRLEFVWTWYFVPLVRLPCPDSKTGDRSNECVGLNRLGDVHLKPGGKSAIAVLSPRICG